MIRRLLTKILIIFVLIVVADKVGKAQAKWTFAAAIIAFGCVEAVGAIRRGRRSEP